MPRDTSASSPSSNAAHARLQAYWEGGALKVD
ncbi:hypothetical protein OOU_Y34scaffold00590g61 [Pyricularia oryzae Y34]|uniref:Uncharacterized protein n=1 Tax=Pyricularia oryzae (strain Y34) TaxID=1143189 RepID=A0AA97PK20_PYRO3|nr:hypothetical protein OOU_Y34scaffold00590g61 [Pyricularia oryzae Y34]